MFAVLCQWIEMCKRFVHIEPRNDRMFLIAYLSRIQSRKEFVVLIYAVLILSNLIGHYIFWLIRKLFKIKTA